MTLEADSSTGLQEPGAGFVGMDDSGCGGGCFRLEWVKVVSLFEAKDSSLLAILTTPLKSPSSLAATRAAKVFSGSFTSLKAIKCD